MSNTFFSPNVSDGRAVKEEDSLEVLNVKDGDRLYYKDLGMGCFSMLITCLGLEIIVKTFVMCTFT